MPIVSHTSSLHTVLLLLLLVSLPSSLSDESLRIPQILHRNFMGGADALYQAVQDPQSGFKAHWLASCKTHNPDWQETIWDAAATLQLVKQDFPWFLQTYLSYPKLVQRSDVTRYMVLYKYGGVYLDADVECYTQLDHSLRGKNLVLNCEYPEAQAQIHNAAMASVPGHPFWLEVLQEAMLRAPAVKGTGFWSGLGLGVTADRSSSSMKKGRRGDNDKGVSSSSSTDDQDSGISDISNSTAAAAVPPPLSADSSGVWGTVQSKPRQLLARMQKMWEASPFADPVNVVLRTTGPMLLTSVYKRHIGGGPVCGRSVEVGGRVNHVYELGSWFTPCFWSDEGCQRWARWLKWLTQHMLLTRAAGGVTQQQQWQRQQQAVVGIHHYSGSWTDWDLSSKREKQQQLMAEISQHVAYFFRDSPMFVEYACQQPLSVDGCKCNSSSSSGSEGAGGSSSSSSSTKYAGEPAGSYSPTDVGGGSSSNSGSGADQGAISTSSTSSSRDCVGSCSSADEESSSGSSSNHNMARGCNSKLIPLCVQCLTDCFHSGGCVVVSILHPQKASDLTAAAAIKAAAKESSEAAASQCPAEQQTGAAAPAPAAAAVDAFQLQDLQIELQLLQLGCHLVTVSADAEAPLQRQQAMQGNTEAAATAAVVSHVDSSSDVQAADTSSGFDSSGRSGRPSTAPSREPGGSSQGSSSSGGGGTSNGGTSTGGTSDSSKSYATPRLAAQGSLVHHIQAQLVPVSIASSTSHQQPQLRQVTLQQLLTLDPGKVPQPQQQHQPPQHQQQQLKECQQQQRDRQVQDQQALPQQQQQEGCDQYQQQEQGCEQQQRQHGRQQQEQQQSPKGCEQHQQHGCEQQQLQEDEATDAELPAATNNADAAQDTPFKYIVRFSCGNCGLEVFKHWFEHPRQQHSLLQRVEMLLLDMQLPVPTTAGDVAATVDNEGCRAGESTGFASNSAESNSCSGDTSKDTCSSNSGCSNSSSSREALSALGPVYNLLYQQHGFVGFLREQLPGGVLRLGFVRQPSRLGNSNTVLASRERER